MYRIASLLHGPFLAAFVAALVISGATAAPAGDEIRINGSGACLELMKPLAAAYGKEVRGASFRMEKPLGSSGSIRALLDGALDIAVVARPLKAEEIARGGTFRPFGKTPLAVVAAKSIPLKTVSTSELADIYAGRTVRWSDGETVRVILRPKGDTDTLILMGLSPGMAEAVAQAHRRPGTMIAVTDIESNEAVSRTVGGIGTAALNGVLIGGQPLNIVDLNGIAPTRKNLADGAYPMAKDIGFVTTGRLSGNAARFLRFVYSKKGRAVAERYGVLITVDGK